MFLRPSIMYIQISGIKRWVAPTLRELERRRKKVGPLPPQPRSTFLEWNYDAEIFAFSKRLREEFDENLLRRAFTHRSYVIQKDLSDSIKDNSDLIKEGEQFIVHCIEQKFEHNLPEATDAVLSYLTTEATLARVAFHMGVSDLILSSDFPVENNTLSKTFKAIVGALIQSKGSDQATEFVNDFLFCQLNGKDLFDIWNIQEPYRYLLEIAQKRNIGKIEPRLCNKSAENTILSNYQVGLYNNKKLLGIGWGESMDIAKDTAALDAIQKLSKKQLHII